jgi:hypothetical protein
MDGSSDVKVAMNDMLRKFREFSSHVQGRTPVSGIDVSSNGTTTVSPDALASIVFDRFREMHEVSKDSVSQEAPKALER